MDDASFLILFLAITAIMAIIPFILKRFGIPAVISLLIVGMLIGDTGIGVDIIPRLADAFAFLGPKGQEAITGPSNAQHFTIFLQKLGSLGLMFLMALAGMEADFKLIKSCRKPVTFLSILTFLLPAVGGFFLYRHYFPNAIAGQLLYASLFASHSVGIVFPVMHELKLSRTRFGASVLISTVITDIASIILLAVSVQLFRQNTDAAHMVLTNTLSVLDHSADILGNSFLPVFLGIVLVYLAIMVWSVDKIGRWFIDRLNPSEDIMITLILLVILGAAIIGELFGINFIIGSFIAGLGLARVVREQDMLLFKRFESIGYGFLIPFLFITIGMETNFRVFAAPGSLEIVLLTILVLVGTKIGSGYIAMRASGFSRRAGVAAGLMTVPQLSATLTAAAIGRNLGILDPQFFNAIIILSIVTALPVPSIVRKILSNRPGHVDSPHLEDFSVPDVVQDSDLF